MVELSAEADARDAYRGLVWIADRSCLRLDRSDLRHSHRLRDRQALASVRETSQRCVFELEVISSPAKADPSGPPLVALMSRAVC